MQALFQDDADSEAPPYDVEAAYELMAGTSTCLNYLFLAGEMVRLIISIL